ncbi:MULTISPECIES: AAA family ATPase [unclassified Paenibacillus]|uniref:AAA family ATPase n=1 Tax=unclassified Paenibacillus TaxID=185978 RepID=UPI001AE7A8FD|nr:MULTISPECIES: AAA family ATPase [unclassified Paenibacillus]MBP1155029.1 putative kinase [Paenibacillus sp. PvP091]MBP1169588.1 putative kinase [Paenibacillus sp. PvR098]MBP2440616.1 putative kinase [Paenibacillus sp. PvP052]
MRKLVFFIGPAGAGKTTLAKALAKKRRAAFFDMDTLLRPSAEAIMSLSGLDPDDRDSPLYKTRCRDLGYRVTMDTALDNVELGTDSFVVGPFTKESEDPQWIERELSRIGASLNDVDVKAVFVFLPNEELYRNRIQERGLPIDMWKLENWGEFSRSLVTRQIKWHVHASSVLYFDNSEQLSEEKLSLVERFVYKNDNRPLSQ